MHYLLIYSYVEDIVEKRTPYREEHLALAKAAHARGELMMAGALTEPTDGAALVFRTDDPEVVRNFAESDPYMINGLVTKCALRPWNVVIGA
jgi:uncharacterized protein YciI